MQGGKGELLKVFKLIEGKNSLDLEKIPIPLATYDRR